MGRTGGRGVVVVLAQLAAFAALVGLPLPAGSRAVLVVAYLLGMRWAVEPGNAAVVGVAQGRLSGLGRPAASAGMWFAAGFSGTVAGLAVVATMGVQAASWRYPRLAPDGDYAAVFLGLLAIVQVMVLIGAVRARRDGRAAMRPGLERLSRNVRRSWQLLAVGALAGVGIGIAVEIGLLVLAGGMVALTAPWYLTIVLPLLFAAGMFLVTAVGAARQAVVHIVLTSMVAGAALVVATMLLNGVVGIELPAGLVRLVDDAQEQPAAFGEFLLDRPGLLAFLLLVLVAALLIRRARTGREPAGETRRGTGTESSGRGRVDNPAGPGKPGLLAQARRKLGERKATPQAAAPAVQRPAGRAAVAPMPPQAIPVSPAVPYRQRVVARATITDPVRAVVAPEVTGIAVVTGAGAGTGRAIALALAAAGYGILAADLDEGIAASCAAEARAYGVPAQAVRVDVRDPRHLEKLVAVAEEWGRTSVLVTAGAGGWPSPVPDCSAEMVLAGLLREPMSRRGGGAVVAVVPAVSAEAPALIRFAGESAAVRDGVRVMCLTTDQPVTAPAAVVPAVLDLVRRGSAGAVVELGGPGRLRQFARGTAAVG